MDRPQKTILGLVGFRCSGKSFLRRSLESMSIPVFNTNSVRTPDNDANTISLEDIISRYGNGRSYLYFLRDSLTSFSKTKEMFIVDSFKTASDPIVCKELLPDCIVRTIYLHTPYIVRLQRYNQRDILTGLRDQDLSDHDRSLEKFGIWELIKNSDYIIDMTKDICDVNTCITSIIKEYI